MGRQRMHLGEVRAQLQPSDGTQLHSGGQFDREAISKSKPKMYYDRGFNDIHERTIFIVLLELRKRLKVKSMARKS